MMSETPLSDAEANAMATFVDPYICAIQYIPKGDTSEPPGRHHGTGWFFEHEDVPFLVTCEHVAKYQQWGTLAYACFESEEGTSFGGKARLAPHPVDAAVACIERTFAIVRHGGRCVNRSFLAERHAPVEGELLFAYGFPRADARQGFGTHSAQGVAVFLRQVNMNSEVFNELLPHPDPRLHISLAWSPEHAVPMLQSKGALSLPDGMSGSPLWNTRYEEFRREGRPWTPANARITGIIWGHSSKASQLYATPIEMLLEDILC